MNIILKYTLAVFFCCLPARSICGEVEEFPSPSVVYSDFIDAHMAVSTDMYNFWQYVDRETFGASTNILNEELKDISIQREAYDMRKIVKLYELNKTVGFTAVCLFFFSTKEDSIYRLLLNRYMNERLGLLRTKASSDDVLKWFKEQENIFNREIKL